ncbi:MAG: HAMP domain-containing protein [Candidatus Thiodiazotropha sp. (ex Lucinoma borealis)]|nr:HAMP domain-containing protein [Candidatus Thiodiazotropha sp. (ex Lucinoma borealis)]
MGRLFWKIFLWFWLAMILMTFGIAWGMAQLLQSADERYSIKPLNRIAVPQVTAVATVLEYGGESAAKALVEEITGFSPLQILVIDEQGRELLGRSLPKMPVLNPENKTGEMVGALPSARFEVITDRIVDSPEGSRYRVTAGIPAKHKAAIPLRRALPFGMLRPFNRDPWFFYLRLGMAVLVSGLVCFWLAWYLATPVKRLREASRRLSEGDLDARVANAIGRRRDEIADLGQDFDWMAERLQALIASQKQLISDISHELRSPLARLQVAVGLTRKKVGDRAGQELARIEREVDRLDDLVGQILTLARLEVSKPDVCEDYIDLTEFFETIVEDAEYEAVNRGCHVCLTSRVSCTLKVNTELLRRAVENIIRNAVRYTQKETMVEVDLRIDPERKGWVGISVCDCGPGVKEHLLPKLFEPFVRLADARDRGSGGHGLGLAIAKRAIVQHGGQVFAYNREGKGLCVEMRLPIEQ